MGFTEFQQEVLEEHNDRRAKHSAPPLQLNEDMCEYAQAWADKLAAENKLEHRKPKKYGENLYASFGRASINGKDAVDSWYKEIEKYTFGSSDPGDNFKNVGHFTQVAWKGSQKLGVGIASKDKKVYVVCNYDPPGNIIGKYAEHVSAN